MAGFVTAMEVNPSRIFYARVPVLFFFGCLPCVPGKECDGAAIESDEDIQHHAMRCTKEYPHEAGGETKRHQEIGNFVNARLVALFRGEQVRAPAVFFRCQTLVDNGDDDESEQYPSARHR